MPRLLARLISAQKWRSRVNIAESEIPADAVTSDLRTASNCLSFWACDTGAPDTVENVVVALASARDTVQRLDLVWLDEDHVRSANLKVEETSGDTPAKPLAGTHRDVIGIDLLRLVALSQLIDQAVKGNQTRRFTEREVASLLARAVRDKIIDASGLKPGIARRLTPAAP